MARSSPYNPIVEIQQIDPANGMQAIDPLSGAPVFSQRLNSVSYASIEAGNRERTYDSDFYHLIAGLKGEFAKDYFWEIGYVFDEQDLVRTDTGDQRFSLLAPAVANGSFNPFVGLDAPRQGTLNGFTYDNAAALRAAGYKATSKTETQNQLLDGKIGGRAFTGLPQGGVSFVVGFDLRRQDLSQNADPILVADDGLGFDADTKFKAEQKVAAAYLELNIPFVSSTMKVPLVLQLRFHLRLPFRAVRDERYRSGGWNHGVKAKPANRRAEICPPLGAGEGSNVARFLQPLLPRTDAL